MKNVVCIKWGEKYSAEYVNRLYGMVQRQLSLPHRFVCLTEDSTGIDSVIETLPLIRTDLKHSYTKLQLFLNPLHDIQGQILFLDLDTVILNSIDDLFLHKPEAKFIGLHEWFDDFLGSSTFRFEAGQFPFVLEEWDKSVKNRFTEEHIFAEEICLLRKLSSSLSLKEFQVNLNTLKLLNLLIVQIKIFTR